MRRMRGAYGLKRLGAVSTGHMIDGGDGVRLHGLHTTLPGMQPRGLALLLHGWEGSTESSYMRMTAVQLLRRGFEVFRLNFRDHRSEEHTSELQSLMRISYAVFCLKKKNNKNNTSNNNIL